MLEGVISSRTKVNVLVRLFLNPDTKSYLRELASEFQVSSNAVRVELNLLKKHQILVSEKDGRQILYRANVKHPLFPELSSMVRKITGIDALVSSVVDRLGDLKAVYLTGDYARGKDSGIIDVVLVGEINREQLDDVIKKTERYIGRKIRPLVLGGDEFLDLQTKGTIKPVMTLWDRDSR